MLISERIKQNYAFLSNKQKKIADYLLDHDDEMGFKTLKIISKEVGVTEVTVINFCKALGFGNFTENGVYSELLPNVIEQQIQNHTRTLYRLDEQKLSQTIEFICNAKKIYIFHKGTTGAVALFLKTRLDNLAIDSELVDVSVVDNRFFMNSMRFTKDDIYIFFTYPVYSKILIKFSEYFRKKDFKIIALTDKYDSPITKYADISFYTDNDSPVFFNSFQSLMSIVEIIVILLHTALKDRLLAYKEPVEEMEKEFELFTNK